MEEKVENIEKFSEKPVENERNSPLAKAAKIIAIVAFCLCMTCLATAITSDIVIFSEQIIQFILAVVMCGFLFYFLIIAFLVSFVLIFGFYIVKSHGFWPAKITIGAFKGLVGEIKVGANQLVTVATIRWILLVLCFLCFIASIVSLIFLKILKKHGFVDKKKTIKKFDASTILFSILGIAFASIILLMLSSTL